MSRDVLIVNLRGFLAILAATAIAGCSSPSAQPVPVLTTLDTAAARLSDLSGQPIRLFATRDFGRDRNTAARSVLVAEDQGPAIVAQLRSELGSGLVAFVGCTRSLADPPDVGCEVVVAAGDSQFDILRIAQSDAVNYGMDTEDLIQKLQEYDSKYGIDVFHAETDTIEFSFQNLPDDLPAFCKDLYDFCPDIVEQGAGTLEELEREITKTGAVFLWWD